MYKTKHCFKYNGFTKFVPMISLTGCHTSFRKRSFCYFNAHFGKFISTLLKGEWMSWHIASKLE